MMCMFYLGIPIAKRHMVQSLVPNRHAFTCLTNIYSENVKFISFYFSVSFVTTGKASVKRVRWRWPQNSFSKQPRRVTLTL